MLWMKPVRTETNAKYINIFSHTCSHNPLPSSFNKGRMYLSAERNGCRRCVSMCNTGNLWYRQGLTPSYPQGSVWELICGNVCKVSIGPLDQVRTLSLVFL